jgi:hypothetical protein
MNHLFALLALSACAPEVGSSGTEADDKALADFCARHPSHFKCEVTPVTDCSIAAVTIPASLSEFSSGNLIDLEISNVGTEATWCEVKSALYWGAPDHASFSNSITFSGVYLEGGATHHYTFDSDWANGLINYDSYPDGSFVEVSFSVADYAVVEACAAADGATLGIDQVGAADEDPSNDCLRAGVGNVPSGYL